MLSSIEVVSVNVSAEKGTAKQPVGRIEIDALGVVGDGHAGMWHRQVSLLSRESIDRFSRQTGRPVLPGEFAENVTISGMEMSGVAVLDRFRFGELELEVSQIGKQCHGQGCLIFQQVGDCLMPTEGVFASCRPRWDAVPATAENSSPARCFSTSSRCSDRAAAGQYADRSGPRIKELVESFLAGSAPACPGHRVCSSP